MFQQPSENQVKMLLQDLQAAQNDLSQLRDELKEAFGVSVRIKLNQSVFLMLPFLNPRCLSQHLHWLQEKHEFR